MKNQNFLTIREAAKTLGVSIDTLRRWDKKGILRSIRPTPTSHRYYQKEEINNLLPRNDISNLAKNWAVSQKPPLPQQENYCETSDVFNARLERMGRELGKIKGLEKTFPLIVAITGEIGNNSFNHNIGNWPDTPGIFFGYDLLKRQITLADRGQGLLQTLKRVRPLLKNDEEALQTAFTEFISSRAPEDRGNGLKFVKNVIMENDLSLLFLSGDAELHLKKNDKKINIKETTPCFHGCMAVINF
ncbi:MAG: helix-turn-helix domain-containing protein [Candidatus Gracilibacteria bacterium]